MPEQIKDIHGKPLQEGFYVRHDRILGNDVVVENIVYLTRKEDGRLYQEGLQSVINPLQVSNQTRFKPLSQRDLDWLRERLDITDPARVQRDIAQTVEDALIDTS